MTARVLITDTDTFLVEYGEVEIGRIYNLESAEHKTSAQRRFFHPILQEYFNSGKYSYECHNWTELKDIVKEKLGQGFEYSYMTKAGKWIEHATFEQLQEAVTNKEVILCEGGKLYAKRDLIHSEDYTKKQYTDMIKNIIAEMDTVGVDSKKYLEMVNEIRNEWRNKRGSDDTTRS